MTGRAQRIEARCRKYQAVKHDMTGRGCKEQTAPHGAWRLTVSRKSADDPAGRSEWRRKCAAARAVRRECAAARAAPREGNVRSPCRAVFSMCKIIA